MNLFEAFRKVSVSLLLRFYCHFQLTHHPSPDVAVVAAQGVAFLRDLYAVCCVKILQKHLSDSI